MNIFEKSEDSANVYSRNNLKILSRRIRLFRVNIKMASKVSPDKTLQHYKAQTFKTSTCKSVPFEELNYNVCKPSANMVAFKTTETGLPLWIKALLCRYHVTKVK